MFSLITLLSTVVFSISSNNKNIVRSNTIINEEDYFINSIIEEKDDSHYKATASKKISKDLLQGYETVSLIDEEKYSIIFEVNSSNDDKKVNLTVFFENTKEKIIENFVGYPIANYNNEKDIVFYDGEEQFFLSELQKLQEVEQCSLVGKMLHKTLNASLLTISLTEPVTKLLLYTYESLMSCLYSCASNGLYAINYAINKALQQPTDYVYGQDAYYDWHFGVDFMDDRGCEVIAAYNLLHAKGRNTTLAEVILGYELLGIEMESFLGYFGSNPYQIFYYLDAVAIDYEKVLTTKRFEKLMNDSNDYYIIISYWCTDEVGSTIHTYFVDKDCSRTLKFKAYNYDCLLSSEQNKSTQDYANYLDYFKNKLSSRYICSYFIKK